LISAELIRAKLGILKINYFQSRNYFMSPQLGPDS